MRIPFYFVATLLLFGASAWAETQCPPLKMIASVDLIPLANQVHQMVPVLINGRPKTMIIDLGSEVSTLSQETLDDLKLDSHETHTQVFGISGAATNRYTMTDVQIGALKGNIKFMVDNGVVQMFHDPQVAGTLGADILAHFDLSIDYGSKKLDLISPDHCDGNVLYWKPQAVAVIPFKIWHKTKIVFEVTLDGQKMYAVLDTSASRSMLRLGPADRYFGIKPGTDDTPVTGHLNEREDLPTYSHTFKALDLNGLSVINPTFILYSDRTSKILGPPQVGYLVPVRDDAITAPIIVGMNVLKQLHIYIAYKEKKIYISPAGPPKAASAAQ